MLRHEVAILCGHQSSGPPEEPRCLTSAAPGGVAITPPGALRCPGNAAICDLDPAGFDPDGDLLGYVTGLQMTSLVGMVDPARDESKAAVASAKAAHIRVRMVTGDDVITGAAIAKQVGIAGEAILGADFAGLPEDERLARIGVVGRVAPEHKVLLADALKKKGEVVAMTGDGVNDAPAIKAADIGIAMGSGTEVAKNAGRIILSDDNFATIVFAVEQGRKIYDNLTKYIRFVLVLLVVFVLTFLGAALFNIAAGEPFSRPGAVDPLRRQRPVRLRTRLRPGKPRAHGPQTAPRGESVLTTPVMVTVGLTGLAITIGLLTLRSRFTELNPARSPSSRVPQVRLRAGELLYFRAVPLPGPTVLPGGRPGAITGCGPPGHLRSRLSLVASLPQVD